MWVKRIPYNLQAYWHNTAGWTVQRLDSTTRREDGEDADPPRVCVLQTHTGAAFEAGRVGSGDGERLGNVATAMEAAA